MRTAKSAVSLVNARAVSADVVWAMVYAPARSGRLGRLGRVDVARPALELEVQPDQIADVRLVLDHQHRACVATHRGQSSRGGAAIYGCHGFITVVPSACLGETVEWSRDVRQARSLAAAS